MVFGGLAFSQAGLALKSISSMPPGGSSVPTGVAGAAGGSNGVSGTSEGGG